MTLKLCIHILQFFIQQLQVIVCMLQIHPLDISDSDVRSTLQCICRSYRAQINNEEIHNISTFSTPIVKFALYFNRNQLRFPIFASSYDILGMDFSDPNFNLGF